MLLTLSSAIAIFFGVFVPPCSHGLPVDFDFDCRGLPENFLFWWACGSYGVCRGGQYVQVDCVNGTSYDRVLGDCRDNQGVNFPCNRQPNCLDYEGAGFRYAETARDEVENLPACTFYYTCSYGRYLGHQRCNRGTVYDESRQSCLRPDKVPPPCGTFNGDQRDGIAEGNTGFTIDQNGRAVIGVPVDSEGNIDQRQWPFTNNNNNNNNYHNNHLGGVNSRRRPRLQQPLQPSMAYRGGNRQAFNPSNFEFSSKDYQGRRFIDSNSDGQP